MTSAVETLFERAQALLTMADSVRPLVAEVSDLRADRLMLAFVLSPPCVKASCQCPCGHEKRIHGV
jgi:hypothetical protein